MIVYKDGMIDYKTIVDLMEEWVKDPPQPSHEYDFDELLEHYNSTHNSSYVYCSDMDDFGDQFADECADMGLGNHHMEKGVENTALFFKGWAKGAFVLEFMDFVLFIKSYMREGIDE